MKNLKKKLMKSLIEDQNKKIEQILENINKQNERTNQILTDLNNNLLKNINGKDINKKKSISYTHKNINNNKNELVINENNIINDNSEKDRKDIENIDIIVLKEQIKYIDILVPENLVYKYILNRFYEPILTANYNCLDNKCGGVIRIRYKYVEKDIMQIIIEKEDLIKEHNIPYTIHNYS